MPEYAFIPELSLCTKFSGKSEFSDSKKGDLAIYMPSVLQFGLLYHRIEVQSQMRKELQSSFTALRQLASSRKYTKARDEAGSIFSWMNIRWWIAVVKIWCTSWLKSENESVVGGG